MSHFLLRVEGKQALQQRGVIDYCQLSVVHRHFLEKGLRFWVSYSIMEGWSQIFKLHGVNATDFELNPTLQSITDDNLCLLGYNQETTNVTSILVQVQPWAKQFWTVDGRVERLSRSKGDYQHPTPGDALHLMFPSDSVVELRRPPSTLSKGTRSHNRKIGQY